MFDDTVNPEKLTGTGWPVVICNGEAVPVHPERFKLAVDRAGKAAIHAALAMLGVGDDDDFDVEAVDIQPHGWLEATVRAKGKTARAEAEIVIAAAH